MEFNNFKQNFLKRLFPRDLTCSACGIESFTGLTLCKECNDQLVYNNSSICEHCGRRATLPTTFCENCVNINTSFDLARSVFIYEDPISKLIKRFKYDNCKYIAEFFVGELAKIYDDKLFDCDFMVYAPMSESKIKGRGYNHSQILAHYLSGIIGLPVIDDILIRRYDSENQVGLGYKERITNLENDISVRNRKQVKGKKILVIDDVMTTGSTLETIAKALKRVGATRVCGLIIASVERPK